MGTTIDSVGAQIQVLSGMIENEREKLREVLDEIRNLSEEKEQFIQEKRAISAQLNELRGDTDLSKEERQSKISDLRARLILVEGEREFEYVPTGRQRGGKEEKRRVALKRNGKQVYRVPGEITLRLQRLAEARKYRDGLNRCILRASEKQQELIDAQSRVRLGDLESFKRRFDQVLEAKSGFEEIASGEAGRDDVIGELYSRVEKLEKGLWEIAESTGTSDFGK